MSPYRNFPVFPPPYRHPWRARARRALLRFSFRFLGRAYRHRFPRLVVCPGCHVCEVTHGTRIYDGLHVVPNPRRAVLLRDGSLRRQRARATDCPACHGDLWVCNRCFLDGARCQCPDEGLPTGVACTTCQPPAVRRCVAHGVE